LSAGLEQAHLKIVEAEECQSSLRLGYTKLEDECESLCTVPETVKLEKVEAEMARDAEVTTIRTKFQDYRVHHRNKLHDLWFSLEKAVSEFGIGCLPYPGKNSPIGNIIGCFDNETKALPANIEKANKNFICYDIVGVLRMLYDNSCRHIEGLQLIMASCDAFFLSKMQENCASLY
jgi:hypothetical protein